MEIFKIAGKEVSGNKQAGIGSGFFAARAKILAGRAFETVRKEDGFVGFREGKTSQKSASKRHEGTEKKLKEMIPKEAITGAVAGAIFLPTMVLFALNQPILSLISRVGDERIALLVGVCIALGALAGFVMGPRFFGHGRRE